MTVISCVITQYCTAHASDSFITSRAGTVKESQKTKIVAVPHWRGVFAFWGLAEEPEVYHWSTLEWLQKQANRADRFQSVEDFARNLTDELNKAISSMKFQREIDSGIGIHFTTYEHIDGYWIPELFRISNFIHTSYDRLYSNGIHISRETYNIIAKVTSQPHHRDPQYRLAVHEHLHSQGGMLIYNNGDPLMFNPIADGILNSIRELAKRGNLSDRSDVATYRAIAQMPINVVSEVQRRFGREGSRLVGGKPHNLAVTPSGVYSSDTGDI